MHEIFKAFKITDKVYWVGAIDWAVRNFHGYLTSAGTTYNAYLILSDKITLIDTVKAPFKDEMLARITSLIPPEKIDFIISNHSEPDHTGCLAEVIYLVKPQKVFASKMGVQAIGEHYGIADKITPVADGEKLDIGGRNISFFETRMCHWPDSMVSYLHEDKLLFSQDAFGMHVASYERFSDELDEHLVQHEAAKYYANILLPFGSFIRKTLEKLSALENELKIIAPDHGPIWRQNPKWIIDSYARWAEQKRTNKAIVIFDTMWSSTCLMARAIGEGLAAGGARTRLMPLENSHRSNVAAEILDAGALLIGSPTINNDIFPTLADVVSYIKGLRPVGLIGAAFGSFGWGGEAPKNLQKIMQEMGIELVDEPLRVKYHPDNETLKKCYELGLKVAKKLPQPA